MLITKCPTCYTCDMTVEDEHQKQINLTVFPKVFDTLFNKTFDETDLEERLLEMEPLKFTFNSRHIVSKIEIVSSDTDHDAELSDGSEHNADHDDIGRVADVPDCEK